jgi:hypothetical protein
MRVSPINGPLLGSKTLPTKTLVKDLMTSAVVCCTPWDTAQSGGELDEGARGWRHSSAS